MIKVTDKSKCCGCEACVSICPRSCIRLVVDSEGFSYPEVDYDKCVKCGICEKSCPILHPFEPRTPLFTLAAINRDKKIQKISSSGGFFTALAQKVISENGVVFGVKFDENWLPKFSYTESIDGLKAFCKSKYVQAKVGTAYRDCKNFLRQGRKVLFCGTPCQISALYHVLGKRWDGLLITVDFVCHGVPSPKIWKGYLLHLFNGPQGLSEIQEINFRDKQESWARSHFKVVSSRKTINNRFEDNPYMRAFLSDLSLRPACYDCQAKCGRSAANLTMGDCWGIESFNPDFNDELGVSLIIVNDLNGEKAINGLDLVKEEIEYEMALKYNPAIEKSALRPKKRQLFFKLLHEGKTLEEINEKVFASTFIQRLVWSLKRRIRL